ncbi:actin interacting protein 3 domain-containing protein [Phthorimaea operculella]|nr:actin interacting protein 3 domain-containing protein [Phthorimaea operculella]
MKLNNFYYGMESQINSLDIEPPLPRYPPPTNNLLFDDDPGIMSEVETASTGFRRGGKQRSSLPVVRTPSKTLERPLGLVFLQYRSETKRALLPNEITSIDTVKALFVRSFPKQLNMQYMDSPHVKIYIHDSNKDMFYELEDVRAHLRDIRDRSVLRLFESTDMQTGTFPMAVGVGSLAIPPAVPPAAVPCSGPSSWDQDQSYFSEPEIDSEYHHQHVHKSKVSGFQHSTGETALRINLFSKLPNG